MSMRRMFSPAALTFLALLIGQAGLTMADDVIARFQGTTKGIAGGHKVMMLGVTLISNGSNALIPIPNEDPKKMGEPMPKGDLDAEIKKLTVGQVIKITVDPVKDYNGPVLTSIAAYDTKPGEDTPNGYVFSKTFDKTVGKNTLTTVVLTKFGKEYTFGIAMHKGDSGQEQDPDVVAAIGKLSENSGVWVQTVGKNIVAIEPYEAPKTGKVEKLSDANVDGHKIHQAEIATDDGKTVTVMVPGKEVGKTFVADSLVAGQLAKVKAGTQVEFRVHEDGDKLWLREITAVKPGPKKPADTMKK